MKIKINKSILKQVINQVLMQQKKRRPAPKGTNIRRVLKRAQDAGKQGRSWTELHNAVQGKSPDSDWSNQNRGRNISCIDRRAGKPHGFTEQGDHEDRPYEDNPLIKKLENGNYVITQAGRRKLKQLDVQLGRED